METSNHTGMLCADQISEFAIPNSSFTLQNRHYLGIREGYTIGDSLGNGAEINSTLKLGWWENC